MTSLHEIVRVEFRYQVHFTRGVFNRRNTILRDVILSAREGRRKVLVVVEEQVSRAFPALMEYIMSYANAHADAVELAGDPQIIPGGEWIKQTKAYVDRIRAAIHENQ